MHGNANGHKSQLRMASMAIIMTIIMAISAMIMAIHGNDHGHTGHTNANANGQKLQ